MATIPLIRNKNDMYYRYQMPKLAAKIEGSGNGIRTVVTNMVQIAKAINRPAAYVTKFFGYELGAQVKMDALIYSVNGSHDADKLLSLLYSFIEKFVLCSKCQNPETDLSVSKQLISLKCKACGSITTISERTHRLTTYIVNHCEDAKKDAKGGKKVKGKKGEDASKTSTTTTSNGKKTETTLVADDDDFEDSGEDLKVDLLADEFKSSVKIDTADICEKFCQMVKDKADAKQLGDVKIQKELLNEATSLGIRDKSTLALCKALFSENILEEIGKHKILLLRFCVDSPKAQKYLLGGIEKIIELFPKLLASSTKILKEFYDQEILDEEVLIEWYGKASKKYVSKDLAKQIREKAFPFIKWLKEAEVEEDSDSGEQQNGVNNGDAAGGEEDEDGDEDDIGFSHRVSGIHVETVKNKEDAVDDSFIDEI